MVNLVCKSQHFVVCLKVIAIGQEGQPNLLDTDWRPQSGGNTTAGSCLYLSKLMYLAYFFASVIASSSHLCSNCDHNAYFCEIFYNDFVRLISLFSSLFCNLVESWKVLWKLFWSLFLLTWCIWLCPCACLCCSWCVVSVHSCIFLWLSVQRSFLSPFPSVAEGHQMTDFRVYTIKESTRVLGTRGTAHNPICSVKVCIGILAMSMASFWTMAQVSWASEGLSEKGWDNRSLMVSVCSNHMYIAYSKWIRYTKNVT